MESIAGTISCTPATVTQLIAIEPKNGKGISFCLRESMDAGAGMFIPKAEIKMTLSEIRILYSTIKDYLETRRITPEKPNLETDIEAAADDVEYDEDDESDE